MSIALLIKKEKRKKNCTNLLNPTKKKDVVVGVQAPSGQPNPALWFQLPKNQTSIDIQQNNKSQTRKPGATTTDKNHCFYFLAGLSIGNWLILDLDKVGRILSIKKRKIYLYLINYDILIYRKTRRQRY